MYECVHENDFKEHADNSSLIKIENINKSVLK